MPAEGEAASRLTAPLLTPRLRLEPFAPVHDPLVRALYGDPAVMGIRKLGQLTPAGARVELAKRIAEWGAAGHGMYAVFERTSGRFIGECGLKVLDGDEAGLGAEISYGLTGTARGSGHATEAARTVVAHAFDTLGMPHLHALGQATNLASRRVMEKLGMRLERAEVRGGTGIIRYRLTAAAWQAHRRAEASAITRL